MCTLIVDWSCGRYIVGANRDERLDRKCDDNFTWKTSSTTNEVSYFAPTDLKGGTWFGINNKRVFSAITNSVFGKPIYCPFLANGHSRGKLVTEALGAKNEISAVKLVIKKLVTNLFKPFNLVIGGKESCWLIKGDGHFRFSIEPICGQYIITPDWPIAGPIFDKSYPIHRIDYISKNIQNSSVVHTDWCSYKGEYKMYDILKYRADDKVENAVCVYDPNEDYKTRSSCILHTAKDDGVYLSWTDKAPDIVPLIGPDSSKGWNTKHIHC